MSDLAIKLALPDEDREQINYALKKAHAYVLSKLSTDERLVLFYLKEGCSNVLFTADQFGNRSPLRELSEITWSSITTEVPEFADLFNKYPLEHVYILSENDNVKPHSHVEEKPVWSLTFIDSKEPGILKFYRLDDEGDVNQRYLINGMTEKFDWECIEEIITKPVDIYSIDTYTWHSWQTTDTCPVVSVFHLKGANCREDAVKILSEMVK